MKYILHYKDLDTNYTYTYIGDVDYCSDCWIDDNILKHEKYNIPTYNIFKAKQIIANTISKDEKHGHKCSYTYWVEPVNA